ncbi:MAG TPA: HupE/UreJ family protein [Gammaproteobacteria bacterium]|nr:HupE/UreJ family protein [Gammaproteobacteria bacterium]
MSRVVWLIALGAALLPPLASAHEIPSDVTVHMLVRPEADRVRLLVRAPLEAMQDIVFPTFGLGFLDIPRADRQLRDAAQLWLADNVELYEGERRLPLTIVAVRAAIPSDRSFDDYNAALAHFAAPPLRAEIELVWQQALLDVWFEAPIESPSSLFSLRPRLERLGLRVVNAVRFTSANGVERVYQIEGDAGLVPLDPRWHQALLRFLVLGFTHILDGADHLLFLLCLVVPFRRELRALVLIVTAFTVGHSVTLIGSAYGLAPTELWFPPLVETLIALSIFYMAAENVVAPNRGARWAIALGFGLVHGFGFSFALQNTLQFAGEHVLTSLLSFNVGIELGQLLVLVLLVPALNVVFRYVNERVGGIVLAVIVGHTAWHWLAERFAALRSFDLFP